MRFFFEKGILKSKETIDLILKDFVLLDTLVAATNRCLDALEAGNKIIFAGNGGSAADSQHLAAELVCRYKVDREGLAAVALTVDTSALTAIANDYGYEHIFARQLEAIGKKGDVLFAFSTSGNSENILNLVEKAKDMNIFTIGLTGGAGGRMKDLCNLVLTIPSQETSKIQEAHMMLGHLICEQIETHFYEKKRPSYQKAL